MVKKIERKKEDPKKLETKSTVRDMIKIYEKETEAKPIKEKNKRIMKEKEWLKKMKEEKSTKVSEKESLPKRSRVDIRKKLLNKERSEIATRHLQGGGRGPEVTEKEENEDLGKNFKEYLGWGVGKKGDGDELQGLCLRKSLGCDNGEGR